MHKSSGNERDTWCFSFMKIFYNSFLMFQFHENLLQFILVKEGYTKTKSKYSFLSPKSTTAMYSKSNFGWFVNSTQRSQRCPNTISFFLLSQDSRCGFTSAEFTQLSWRKTIFVEKNFPFQKITFVDSDSRGLGIIIILELKVY